MKYTAHETNPRTATYSDYIDLTKAPGQDEYDLMIDQAGNLMKEFAQHLQYMPRIKELEFITHDLRDLASPYDDAERAEMLEKGVRYCFGWKMTVEFIK